MSADTKVDPGTALATAYTDAHKALEALATAVEAYVREERAKVWEAAEQEVRAGFFLWELPGKFRSNAATERSQ